MFKQKPKIPTTIKRASLVAILAVVTVASFVTLLGQGSRVRAATSSTINFQARLLTATGNVVPDGQYNVEFKLYTALTSSGSSQGSCTGDSACVWVETRTSSNTVRVANGYLTVSLGSVNAFGAINWDQQLWLSMNVGGTSVSPSWDGEMTPRLQLTAVPYAFRAGALIGGSGANTTILDAGTPSGNNTIHLPAASGTVCLQSSTACGFALSTGSSNYIQNGTSIQAAANFAIRSAATGSVAGLLQGSNGQTADLFDLQTWDGSTATNVFSVNNVGALTLNGTGTVNYSTPVGSNVPTKISIPLYDPGAFGQIIAMGVPGAAQSTSRVISLFDARASAHQPTIAVFNPAENDAVGFSWNGSNNMANVQTIDYAAGGTSNGVTVRSGNVGNGNGNSGAVALQSGSIAGGSGTYTSGDVTVQSGNAAGTTGNSGNVWIDVGTATGTKGTVSIGATTANAIAIGNSGTTTSVTGSLNVSGGGSYSLDSTTSGSVTSSGAITITAGAASTWSTSGGNLTVQAATTNTLSLQTGGAGTVNLGDVNSPTINIGRGSNIARTINIGNAGTSTRQTINIGSTSSTSSVTIQGGSNNIVLQTASGSRVQIGSATTDATSVLFTLDSYNTTDPTGLNGSLYYSTSTNTFRCYENAAWRNCLSTGADFIQNQNSAQQSSSNFWISGTGRADTAITTPRLDTAAAGTLTIGNTNATAISLGKTSSNITTTVNGQLLIDPATDANGVLQLQNASGFQIMNAGTVGSSNLISNGGLENNVALSWVQLRGTATATRTTASHYAQSAAMRVAITSASQFDGIKYPITLTPNQPYAISFYAKLVSGGGSTPTLVFGYSNDGTLSGESPCVATAGQSINSNGWTRFACNYTELAANSGSPYIYIEQNQASAMTFDVDNIIVVQQSSQAQAYYDGSFDLSGGVIDGPLSIQNSTDSTQALQVFGGAALYGNTAVYSTDMTRGYRFRTDGGALDFEASGAGSVGELWISGWTGANFTGTQRNFLRMASYADLVMLGDGVASSAPMLLTLANKNDNSNDPASTGVDGSMYYNSVSKSFRCKVNGNWHTCSSGVVFANTSVPSAITSTSETNFGTSYTIPANDCQPGRVYTITAQGHYTTGAANNHTIRIKWGGTLILTSPGGAATAVSSATLLGWRMEAQITCISSTTVEAQGLLTWINSSSMVGAYIEQMENTAVQTVTTTSNQTLQMSGQWSTTGGSMTMRQFIVEASGP